MARKSRFVGVVSQCIRRQTFSASTTGKSSSIRSQRGRRRRSPSGCATTASFSMSTIFRSGQCPSRLPSRCCWVAWASRDSQDVALPRLDQKTVNSNPARACAGFFLPGFVNLPTIGVENSARFRKSTRDAATLTHYACASWVGNFLAAELCEAGRLSRIRPTRVAGRPHLRNKKVERVHQEAELQPIALREAHVERRLTPAHHVIDPRTLLRNVGQVARDVEL